MSKNIILIGAGGLGKEVFHWFSRDEKFTENIKGFLDKSDPDFSKCKIKANFLGNEDTYEFNDDDYVLVHVSIENSSVPVNEPTTRGGVYFSEKYAYKMKGAIKDLTVVPLLTKKMLGPNTEFGELKISTSIELDGKLTPLEILTNLTNSVQTPDSIELSMIIIKLELL